MRRSSQGFTLIELLVALSVAAVLAMLAMPAFQGIFERTRADTDMGELHRALSYARLEAINRGSSMAVVAIDNGDWTGAIEVREGDGADADTLVRRLSAMSAGAELEVTDDADTIEFNSLGGLEKPAAGVTFEYSRGESGKNLSICPSGRLLAGSNC